MRLALTRTWVVLMLLAVALPTLGPLADHHFAERQPGHRHLGPVYYHVHTYGTQHTHVHATPRGDGSQSTAFYNHDSGPAAAVAIGICDVAMQSFMRSGPTSIFLLPLPPEPQAKHNYTAPAEKPPRYLL